jgi:hypothetical protein
MVAALGPLESAAPICRPVPEPLGRGQFFCVANNRSRQAKIGAAVRDVRHWPIADIASRTAHVCFQG